MDHARLACSTVSSIAGDPFAEFTDFQPCCVTLTRKLAGVTGASRRGREGTHPRSCRVPSALVDRRNPTSNPTRGHRRQWLLNAAKSQRQSKSKAAHDRQWRQSPTMSHRFCAAIIAPDPGWWRVYRGADDPASRPPSLLFGRLSPHIAPSHRPVTSPRHMARQSHGPSRALTAWPQVRAVPVLGKRYGP